MKMKSALAVGVHILCLSFSLGNRESWRASVLIMLVLMVVVVVVVLMSVVVLVLMMVVVFMVAVFMMVLMADRQGSDTKQRFLSKPVSGLSALI